MLSDLHESTNLHSSMGLISQSESEYIAQGFEKGIRNDGRLPLQYRPIGIEIGVLQQSSGSARCRLGYTEVLVSVKVILQGSRKNICLQLHDIIAMPCNV